MADYKVGELVKLHYPFWWFNENLGNREGRILSITGYIVVEVYMCENNPIKCFNYEIAKIDRSDF